LRRLEGPNASPAVWSSVTTNRTIRLTAERLRAAIREALAAIEAALDDNTPGCP
jgi:hypothetical protein